jgi:hypothetical protein
LGHIAAPVVTLARPLVSRAISAADIANEVLQEKLVEDVAIQTARATRTVVRKKGFIAALTPLNVGYAFAGVAALKLLQTLWASGAEKRWERADAAFQRGIEQREARLKAVGGRFTSTDAAQFRKGSKAFTFDAAVYKKLHGHKKQVYMDRIKSVELRKSQQKAKWGEDYVDPDDKEEGDEDDADDEDDDVDEEEKEIKASDWIEKTGLGVKAMDPGIDDDEAWELYKQNKGKT